jgi:membrane-bound lytic murein transglycosylase F
MDQKTPAFWLLIFILIAFSSSCKKKEPPKLEDLPAIIKKGELVATTLSGSTSYFDYKGEEMGFDYEMAQELANSLGVKLRLVVASSIPDMIQKLKSGEVDLIAYRLGISNELKEQLAYADLEYIANQVLVQKSGKNAASSVIDLIGKEVYVNANTKYYERLVNLNDEIGGGIIIKTANDSLTVDNLIEMVATGKIQYTVAENDVAKLNKTFFKNIDIKTPVSFAQRSAWAVRHNTPMLLQAINKWMKDKKETEDYTRLYYKYFENSKYFAERSIRIPKGAVSPYDPIFKKYAKQLHWDWELLAAIAHQESRFDSSAVSWAGATGLMQMMPRTAAKFGLSSNEASNPEKNVDAATQYIKSLNLIFRQIEDKEERLKFIVAAYNSGPSHIFDAMALAKKYGKNPTVWYNNTDEYLRLKSHKEYYNDPVCKSGYFRGEETVEYVQEIFDMYEKYKSRK